MAKLLNSRGEKILLGTVLFDGDTTSSFTLKDDYSNYDYIEVIWRPHSTLGQCSDMMIPTKDSKTVSYTHLDVYKRQVFKF